MNTMRKMLMIGVTAASLAVSSASVLAQSAAAPAAQASGPAASAGQQQGQQGQQGQRQQLSPEQREAKMKERFTRAAQQLHDKLKLDASQEQAWNTYLQAMTPTRSAQRPDRAQFESMTTPQRMELHLAKMKEHEAQLSKRLDATKTFYATLNPDQQKVFDTETARFFQGHHGHGHGHGHKHHGGPRQGQRG